MTPSLAALLLAAQAPASLPAPVPPMTARSGGAIAPERAALRLEQADIAIEALPAKRRLSGRATLTIVATAAVPRITLDLDGVLTVSDVALGSVPLPREAWRQVDGQIRIDRPIAAGGTVVVRVTYAGPPRVARRAPWDDGFVWSESNGKPWFASTAQGMGCDLWWPCLDFPQGEPGGVTLHLTVPAGLSAPANGVLTGIDRLRDGRSTWHWKSGPVNPYALAISVGPYRELTGRYRSRYGNVIPLSFWYLEGNDAKAARLFAEFPPMLDFLETAIGPYPFGAEKMGVVETPYLGMEHQTINAYGNGYKPAPEGFDWLLQHEFSHEWFGNQMTAADWDDFWLHEAFAQYMQPLYARWREGDARYTAMLLTQQQRIVARAPLIAGKPQSTGETAAGPGADVYFKGAWMLHTLRHLIGDRAFLAATRRLVYGRPDPRPGNFRPRFGTTQDFIAAVAQESGRDLGWFFDVYLREAALPDLVERRGGNTLTLRWAVPGNRPFPLPVEIAVDGVVQQVPMTGGVAVLPVPAGAHVVLDPMARVLRRSAALERMQAPSPATAR
ncbi:peptidase M1 [Sphingomonas sp. Leaf407]|uniref:M1 family metallopeptidase n=1 Tax=unclassified Sphingomonas TaxID=196159 RepID=UPI0006F3F603|nr:MULTISPECIES: M1 family metallopeptidase [unclassified Sphingomonas]KQN40790.1 peptidase M1 [Sphingomonas sp. Leaf42]KQT30145.1 peptidase M1 [Sphingomonas sp. Leaf407]